MSRLRVRLRANHHRLTFPHTIAVLHKLVPDLQAVEPHWLTIAHALETAEPGGTRPPGFTWTREATLRPDDGPAQQHLTKAQTFAARSPAWLLQIPLPGNPARLGRHQQGLVLLPTPEFVRLLPHLFTDHAPAIWARTWPDLHNAAIDIDRLDPCCDGLSGYIVELFHGLHDTEPTSPQTASKPRASKNEKII
ncbi:MAG: hypothetical protein ACRDTU_08240 [Micromonosporaceae bacterium]